MTLLLDFGVFGPPDESGYRQAERSLIVECDWRLETATQVLAGSGSRHVAFDPAAGDCEVHVEDDAELGPSVLRLVGRRVAAAEVFPPSYMARVEFDGDLTVWIFPDDPKDYTEESDDPSVPWFVTGSVLPSDWEK
jgi:hypothetical protein